MLLLKLAHCVLRNIYRTDLAYRGLRNRILICGLLRYETKPHCANSFTDALRFVRKEDRSEGHALWISEKRKVRSRVRLDMKFGRRTLGVPTIEGGNQN